jgi:Sec-independent protein secretion pathway component TatC
VKARVLYRIASVLLLLFAAGHTIGFRQNVPEWRADAVLASMRSVHFDAQGFIRTYWDFFSAFGLLFSVFLLFAAVLAWLLGGLPAETFARTRSIAWAFAACFVAVTAVNWGLAFTTPIVFSALITVCLIAAAWFSAKTS